MQTTLPRILADCAFGNLRDPLANHFIRPALVERQPAGMASDFLIMPESLEKETALVPKGRTQARLLDTGLLLDHGKGCLLIPLLPKDLHHLGENFVDVEFTWPCHWAPPFILHPGSYLFFTARSRIKIPEQRPHPQDEADNGLRARILAAGSGRPCGSDRECYAHSEFRPGAAMNRANIFHEPDTTARCAPQRIGLYPQSLHRQGEKTRCAVLAR